MISETNSHEIRGEHSIKSGLKISKKGIEFDTSIFPLDTSVPYFSTEPLSNLQVIVEA